MLDVQDASQERLALSVEYRGQVYELEAWTTLCSSGRMTGFLARLRPLLTAAGLFATAGAEGSVLLWRAVFFTACVLGLPYAASRGARGVRFNGKYAWQCSVVVVNVHCDTRAEKVQRSNNAAALAGA